MLGMQAVEAYQALKRRQHDLRLQGYQEVWVPEQSMQKEVESIRCLWKVVFIDTELGKLWFIINVSGWLKSSLIDNVGE